MSYTQLLYHIVLRTKYSHRSIPNEHSHELYKYMVGFIKNKNCKVYRINGMPEHIHLLVSIHPTISVSNFLKDLKVSSSIWLKKQPQFPKFKGWGKGYGCFTCNKFGIERLIEYIKNQRIHHCKEEFREEYIRLMEENGIDSNLDYLFDD